jgi:hypothetical protein
MATLQTCIVVYLLIGLIRAVLSVALVKRVIVRRNMLHASLFYTRKDRTIAYVTVFISRFLLWPWYFTEVWRTP